jgi:acylphosphatase
MSKKIFEEQGGPHRGHAAGDTDVEKQASQLASDVKYKVKQSMSGSTHLSPAQVTKAYMAQLQKSPAPPAVKALAKRKLMGSPSGSSSSSPEQKNEDYTNINLSSIIEQSVVSALTKVFVEHETATQTEIENEYLNSLMENEDKKYKVRVTDKKTGNSYVRYATRAKIAELRANPNISSVEMTEYGTPLKGEKDKGEQTAAVKSGKDYDGDGKVESGAKEYRGAVHNAIQRKKGGKPDGQDTSSVKEEFIGEVKTPKKDTSTSKVQETGVNNYKDGSVKMFPEIKESSYQRFLKVIQEKAVSQNQQQLAGMALAHLRGEMPDASEEVKKMAKMGEKKLRDFAKTKHEGLPEKVQKEETQCKSDNKEKDPREIDTERNLVKNKLRAIGLKMSYEPGGDQIDEGLPAIAAGAALAGGIGYGLSKLGQSMKKDRQPAVKTRPGTIQSNIQQRNQQMRDLMNQSYEPEGNLVSEEESDRENDRAREGGDWRTRSQRPVRRRPSVSDDPRYGSMSDADWKKSSYNPANKRRRYGR